MTSKIVGGFLLISFIIWTAVSVYCGSRYFPQKIQLPPEIIKPTVHELNELAQQIAEPEIKKAKEYWENLPPKEITIHGEDSTYYETKLLYPKGSIDIAKTFHWNFVFPNQDRPADTLSFSTRDTLTVTAYNDSLGASFIGYSDFTQNIENLIISVNPKVYQKESIDRYSLFIGCESDISTADVLLNETISKDYTFTLGARIGVLVHENWFFGIKSGFSKNSQYIGFDISKKIFRIKGK